MWRRRSPNPPAEYDNPREPWGSTGYIPPLPGVDSRSDATGKNFEPGRGAVLVRNDHQYASVSSQSKAIGIVSTLILSQPASLRNFLGFRNASVAANIYIDYGKDASTSSWLMLTPGTIVLFDTAVPQDDVHAIANAGGGLLSWAWSNYNPG